MAKEATGQEWHDLPKVIQSAGSRAEFNPEPLASESMLLTTTLLLLQISLMCIKYTNFYKKTNLPKIDISSGKYICTT